MTTRLEMLDLCITRLGYLRGARVAQFVAEWELCLRHHEHDVTAEQFVVWWKASRATTYRRLAEFREAFPEVGPRGTPSAFMEPLLARFTKKRLGYDVELLDVPYELEAVTA